MQSDEESLLTDVDAPLLQFQKHVATILVLSGLLLLLTFLEPIISRGQTPLPIHTMIVASVVLPTISLFILRHYFLKRAPKALLLVKIAMITMMVMFIFIGITFLLSGDFSSMVQGGVLILFSWFLASRRKVLNEPMFITWYLGRGISGFNLDVANGEILASCPSCGALLGIDPHSLSEKSECPSCFAPLVSDESLRIIDYEETIEEE